MQLAGNNAYFLEAGYVYFSAQAGQVQAVLGGSVAVCLWDGALRHGGMNHFRLPATRNPSEATPSFGNVATLALIRLLEDAGSRRADLQAQIMGGGSPEGVGGDHMGARNVQAARDVLRKKGIQVVAEDVGGHVGRKVHFDTTTGQVVVLKTRDIRQSDWIT